MPVLRHVPPELSSFVGRAAELTAIGAALGAGQLLTLTGIGGCGKTRLAVRACREHAEAWPDGVAWVSLEQETADDQVAARAAEALDVSLFAGADAATALAHSLRGRSLLLVLDNCEHVLDGAASLAVAVLARCPNIAIMATSRAPLGVAGERTLRVAPMVLADAIALFLERAGLDEKAAAGARRVCDRLDRLPLALELAAGWADTLSPAQIADALADPYAMLDGGARTAAFRQQSLETSMRWSHTLLADDERVLFRRLGVFEAGFTAGAVARVAALGDLPGERLLKALRGLIDKSLLVADTTGAVSRYRMLGVVREYALARLGEAGEDEHVRDRHLDFYLSFVDELAPLLETDKDEWRTRVGSEHVNIRAAAEWGLSRPDPERGRRLAAGTAWLWHLEARGTEGLRLLRQAVRPGAGERTALQARVLVAFALVADTALAGDEGYQAAREALELAGEVGDAQTRPLARSLTAIGRLGADLDAARDEAARAHEEAVQAGDGFVADASRALVGLVHLLRDEYSDAVEQLAPAVEGLLSRGDRGVASSGLAWLSLATTHAGDLVRAAELAERSVSVAFPLRDFHRTGTARAALAEIRLLQGRTGEAVAALTPIDETVDGLERPPFIPGWERAHARLSLSEGRPEEAVRWCRREARGAPEGDGALVAETQVVLATALRLSGEDTAAADVLTGLADSSLLAGMPRLRADVLEQQALLAEAVDLEKAHGLHHEALRIRLEHDLTLGCLASVEELARLASRRGDVTVAGVLAGAAERARADIGAAPRPLAIEPAPKPDDVERGRSMTLRDAAAYAARARGPRRRPESGWDSLTPTERSVVDLAVQGLSNPEIATRLFMSRGTVKTHLAHVYAKLQVANRTELANLARQR